MVLAHYLRAAITSIRLYLYLCRSRACGQCVYTCDDGKSIHADFYEGSHAARNPGEPPTPGGSVSLTLSDGRALTLPQTISASGVRFANADDSFVFWNKGNTAFITEGTSSEPTYSNCATAEPAPAGQ